MLLNNKTDYAKQFAQNLYLEMLVLISLILIGTSYQNDYRMRAEYENS
jgi:hypothetical protein